jgi:hypothetical protein
MPSRVHTSFLFLPPKKKGRNKKEKKGIILQSPQAMIASPGQAMNEPESKRQIESAMTNQPLPSPSSVHTAFPGKQEKESNRSNYNAQNVSP